MVLHLLGERDYRENESEEQQEEENIGEAAVETDVVDVPEDGAESGASSAMNGDIASPPPSTSKGIDSLDFMEWEEPLGFFSSMDDSEDLSQDQGINEMPCKIRYPNPNDVSLTLNVYFFAVLILSCEEMQAPNIQAAVDLDSESDSDEGMPSWDDFESTVEGLKFPSMPPKQTSTPVAPSNLPPKKAWYVCLTQCVLMEVRQIYSCRKCSLNFYPIMMTPLERCFLELIMLSVNY